MFSPGSFCVVAVSLLGNFVDASDICLYRNIKIKRPEGRPVF